MISRKSYGSIWAADGTIRSEHTMIRPKNRYMSYRILTADEKEILKRILSYQPKGVAPTVRLPGDDRVEEISIDGTLKFLATKSSKQWYYPVEAMYADADGVTVYAIVFAVEDEVSMLEILKADGSVPSRKPSAEEWEIIDLTKA
jgi:hypothetical protein